MAHYLDPVSNFQSFLALPRCTFGVTRAPVPSNKAFRKRPSEKMASARQKRGDSSHQLARASKRKREKNGREKNRRARGTFTMVHTKQGSSIDQLAREKKPRGITRLPLDVGAVVKKFKREYLEVNTRRSPRKKFTRRSNDVPPRRPFTSQCGRPSLSLISSRTAGSLCFLSCVTRPNGNGAILHIFTFKLSTGIGPSAVLRKSVFVSQL